MKSHDILLLLKLISLDGSESPSHNYKLRELGTSLGIGKSTIATSLKRCHAVNLVRDNHVNRSNLLEFITYALRYVFPPKLGTLTRGIATGIYTFPQAFPQGSRLLTAGEFISVWPCYDGQHTGLSLEPLYKTVPHAILIDRLLYELLICVDSIRMGRARERNFATAHLKKVFDLLPKCKYKKPY